jgi:hypothetical protein
MRPLQRKALLLAALTLFGLVLAAPSFLWPQPHGRTGYPVEYGYGVLLVLASTGTGVEGAVRRAFVALYALFLLFLAYAYLFPTFFRQDAALVEDYKLALNLIHFLSGTKFWLVGAGALAGGVALVVTLDRVLRSAQTHLAARGRALVVTFALWSSAAALAAASVRIPFVFVGAKVRENYRASVEARRRLAALDRPEHDERYRELMKVRLAKKPNVYFLVIEAYGEVVTTWDMTEPYRALMARVRARLERAGYRMRSSYSTSPIHGGRSWLALATLQSGITIDAPDAFAAFEPVSRTIPTLTGFFHGQGYTTASLEPGTNRKTGTADDLYPDDVRFDAAEIDYTGPKWGYGVIPDKYTWDVFRARKLGTLAEPRYVFYMATSTHYPWTAETIPSYESPDWPALPGMDKIGTELRRYYVKSLDYEWHVLCDMLEADRSEDIVVVILGDHQPRLETNFPGEVTFNTPIHILSRDESFVDRFALLGFQEGLFGEPRRAPPLAHAGLFSLLVTALAQAYGTRETRDFAAYMPQGIGLGGLKP